MNARMRHFWLLACLHVLLPFAGMGQCDPGPPSGGGLNRCYDDGFVYVDSSGNAGGVTRYWGYQNVSQVPGNDTIVFHKCTVLNSSNLVQIIDTYSLRGLIPPPPPYSGIFSGPGPVIPDTPVRTLITVPVNPTSLCISNRSDSLLLSWAASPIQFLVQFTTNVSRADGWSSLTNVPAFVGDQYQITLPKPEGIGFFRLLSLGCTP